VKTEVAAHRREQKTYPGWRCRSCGAHMPTGHCKPCYAKTHPKSKRLSRLRMRATGQQDCSRCRRKLPLTQFYRRADRNGYSSQCRTCCATVQQPKRYKGVFLTHVQRQELAALNQRYCPKCKSEKPMGAFGRATNRPGNVDSYCRACRNASGRAKYAADPKTGRAKSRASYYRYQGWGRDANACSAHSAVAHAAHEAVHRALKRGVLVRPDACSLCDGEEYAIHAHHDDYTRALDVIWLCAPCHKLCHALHNADRKVLPSAVVRPSIFLPEVLKLRSAT
jgi:hypothetical protein